MCIYICKACIPLEIGYPTQMKSTQKIWNVHAQRKKFGGDPTQPIFHWLALGFRVGVTQILKFALEVTQIFLTSLDTNMLVSPMRNCGVGGLSQRQDPTQMFLRRSGI